MVFVAIDVGLPIGLYDGVLFDIGRITGYSQINKLRTSAGDEPILHILYYW